MVVLDPQFAVLAAKCMLSLVVLPSPVTAMVVRSPHSNHHEVSGDFHRQRHLVIPPPENKHHSLEEEHDLFSTKKSSGRHKERAFPADPHDVESRESSAHSSFSETRRSRGMGVNGKVDAIPENVQINDKQGRDQEIFQTRDAPIEATLDGILDPLLQATDGTLKAVLGSDMLSPILIGRHHHDKVIVYDNRPRVGIHERSFLEHTHRPSKLNKRVQEGVPGTIEIRRNDTRLASLFVQNVGSSYVLNASGSNSTTLYLVYLGTSSLAESGGSMPVQLQLETFNPESATLERYCATFDPNPPTPKQMSMELCGSNATEHECQLFYYDKVSGYLQPMHYTGNGSSVEVDPSANIGSSGVNEGSDNFAEDENVQMTARDVMQNVDLVFIPTISIAINALLPSSATMAQPSATTVTVTETVTQTDLSSVTSETTTTSVAETGASESASVSSTTQSPGIFDVEVALPSTTSSDAPFSTSSAGSVSSSSTLSPSVDPDSVAASIAMESTSDASSGSQTRTASDTSNYPTPPSLLVQVTQKANPNSLAGSAVTPANSV